MPVISDLIKKIPEEFQDLARAHLPILANMARDDIVAWIDLILNGDYEKAYRITNNKMSPSERIAEQKRLNALYEIYNKDMIGKKDMFADFLRQILLIAVSMLWKEIE